MRKTLLGGALALLILGTAARALEAAPVLQFIDDDYGRARLEARQRKVPIFVEVWAPW